jgi:hypothetical protein
VYVLVADHQGRGFLLVTRTTSPALKVMVNCSFYY